ncbi:MAG: hypothetical protein V3V13_01500 [Paracoccaceae bacterium]
MIFALIYIGLPLAIFFGLVALPKGRIAFWSVVVVGDILGLIWLTYFINIGPIFTGNANADTYTVLAVAISSGAWALASILLAARRIFGANWPRWVWPALIIGALIIVGLPAMKILGI